MVRARGVLSNVSDLSGSLRLNMRTSADFWRISQAAFHLGWSSRSGGNGRPAPVASSPSRPIYHRPGSFLSGIPLGRVEGPLTFTPGRGRKPCARHPQSPAPPNMWIIKFGQGTVEGRARSVHVDPVLKDLKIPFPVRSPATGTFHRRPWPGHVKAAFEDDPAAPEAGGRYAVRGPSTSSGIVRQKRSPSRRPKLETGFAVLRATGRITVGRDLEVVLTGPVSDVNGPAIRRSDPAPAAGFSEIRGRGNGRGQAVGRFPTAPGSSSSSPWPMRFSTASSGRRGRNHRNRRRRSPPACTRSTTPKLRGEVACRPAAARSKSEARLDDGPVERILTPLDLLLPLKGRAAGHVTVSIGDGDVQVTGGFLGPISIWAGSASKTSRPDWTGGKSTGDLALTGLKAGLSAVRPAPATSVRD